MKPFYVIIHPQVKPYPGWFQPEKQIELERILREEEHLVLQEDTGKILKILKKLPKNRLIRVCGIYAEICVWEVWNTLKEKKYNVNIYEPASYNAPN